MNVQASTPRAGNRNDPAALVGAATGGDRVALGRLLSLVEQAGPAADAVDRLVRSAWPGTVIGITGAPGAGKSTLTDAIVAVLRKRGRRVGVLAVDPTSANSGGAILGDRVRMSGHANDDGVFIRSVATRGALGGLTTTVPGVLRVLGACGFDTVVLETVGVGQVELDVAGVAETVVVVMTPGAGDEVQAVKAGVMEIASIFVVNKADLDGTAQTEADLLAAISMRPGMEGSGAQDARWTVPVLRTVARTSDGVEPLVDKVADHAQWAAASGFTAAHRKHRHRSELAQRVEAAYRAAAMRVVAGDAFDRTVDQLVDGDVSVADALTTLVGFEGATI